MNKRKQKYRFKPRFFLLMGIICCMLLGMVLSVASCVAGDASMQKQHYLQGWMMAMCARAYISDDELHYDDAYFDGGYPDEHVGVCTDVIWNAFDGVGITLKDLVDDDIVHNFDAYSSVITVADPNINFRQVPVLEIFFERRAEVLSTDVDNLLAWQAGNIVTFESSHVALVSGLRNIWGRPYIIQHGKDPAAEEDRLVASDGLKISGHYRWPLQQQGM